MTRILWTRLAVDGGRCLVYSPLFGRTYLLENEFSTSRLAPNVFGLSSSNCQDLLLDPAESIAVSGECQSSVTVSGLLPVLYRFFHEHRAIASISRTIRLAKWFAPLHRNRGLLSAVEIGTLVMAVERSVGFSDCYPRTLLTAYLCLITRLNCKVAVGVLSPSKNMHAWCSTNGVIPYEPVPRHWWYSPLVVFDVVP